MGCPSGVRMRGPHSGERKLIFSSRIEGGPAHYDAVCIRPRPSGYVRPSVCANSTLRHLVHGIPLPI